MPAVRAGTWGPEAADALIAADGGWHNPTPEARRRVPHDARADRTRHDRDVVFLLDVDNTLLDNDRDHADLREHLEREFGVASSDRYWAIFEELRSELGYADYLGALQRYRAEVEPTTPTPPAAARCRPSWSTTRSPTGSIPARSTSSRTSAGSGPTVILSDGDVVFQPRKVQRSGLWDAVEGRVLIYIHKEQMLDVVQRCYPARHYVMVDDKLRILAAMKEIWASACHRLSAPGALRARPGEHRRATRRPTSPSSASATCSSSTSRRGSAPSRRRS